MQVRLTINGQMHELDVAPNRSLADVLRADLALTGTKVACGEGTCGSCTVLLDGRAVLSCLTLAAACDGASLETVEGSTELLERLRAAVHRPRRLPVRLLHARPAHVGGRAARAHAEAEPRRDPNGDGRKPVPLRRLRGHRAGRRSRGGGRMTAKLVKTEAVVEGRTEVRWTLVEEDDTPEFEDGERDPPDRRPDAPDHGSRPDDRHRPLHGRRRPAGPARGRRPPQPARQRQGDRRSTSTPRGPFPACAASSAPATGPGTTTRR